MVGLVVGNGLKGEERKGKKEVAGLNLSY